MKMRKIIAVLAAVLMLFSILPTGVFAASGVAITEPTIEVIPSVEEANAGDEIEVAVYLRNIPEPGLIGAQVEIEYDESVMELVTYYDEDEEMWLPQIEVGAKYNASISKYIMFSPIDEETGYMDRCMVQYYRPNATATQVRYEEHFFTATFKIKDDAVPGTYPLTVNYNPGNMVRYGNIHTDFAIQNTSITIHSICQHEYVGVQTVAPTCTTAGETTYTCSACGDSYTETIAALGHSYGVGVQTVAPTCTTTGETTYTCSACGESYTQTVAALGHKFVNGVCDICGVISTIEVIPSVEEANAGDEIEVAVYLRNIPEPGLIGAQVEIEYDESVMELVTYYDEDEEMWLPQIEVGAKYNASYNKYIWFSPIDGETGVSEGCMVSYLRTTAKETQARYEEHFFTATFKIKDGAASGDYTVSVKNYDPGNFVRYGNVSTDFAIEPATVTIHAPCNHDYVAEKTTAPTCIMTGVMTYTCTICGDSYTETIAALGHNYGDAIVTQVPTCTTAGVMTYTCTACGDIYTEAIATIAHAYVGGSCTICGADMPTVQISIEETTLEAGDEFEITVNLRNIPEPGLIGAMVQLEYDQDVMELVWYYDEDWEEDLPMIEVGPKYNVSSNKYITFGPEGKCVVTYYRPYAKETQARYEEHFFTATFKIKDDAASGDYTVSVTNYSPDNFICYGDLATDFAIEPATVTINGTVPVCEHVYDNDYDIDCNNCGEIREVEYAVVGGKTSAMEMDSGFGGLAAKFDVQVNGLAILAGTPNTADYTNATIGGNKLLGMGAIAANGMGPDAEIPCVYLMEMDAASAVFACRVINIPEKYYGAMITFTPYYVLEIDGVATTIYGNAVENSYNGAQN